jgi:hypothetical protein
MASHIKKIIAHLQSMPENQVSTSIIVPLFEKLGYHKVEFFGGTDEEGKDIVCWEISRLKRVKLVVAQVKHFKLKKKSSGLDSIHTITNQLIQCLEKPLIYSDGNVHLPSEVQLISTYEIDTKTLQSRFDQFTQLRDNKITIIDGAELAQLIIDHWPEALTKILGIESNLKMATKDYLNNEILLSALGYHQKKDIKELYTDIDFSLGKPTTRLFFNSDFEPKKILLALDQVQWIELTKLYAQLTEVFETRVSDSVLKQAEDVYFQNSKKHKVWERKVSELQDQVKKNEDIPADKTKKVGKSIAKRLKELIDNEPKSYYAIEIDGPLFVKRILAKREWIENKVAEFNNGRLTIGQLQSFIVESKAILEASAILFQSKILSASLGFNEKSIVRTRDHFEATRFKLPIQQIFDIGLNLLVLGDAGAGKTTSMQMYALNSENNQDRLVICLPLATMLQNWNRQYGAKDDDKIDKLDEAIATYCILKGVKLSVEQFCLELSRRRFVLMLDGLDEAIKSSPWLPQAISRLAEKYVNKVQVIVTSRVSGSYLDKIPFFAITILPFTDIQRDIFINNWFQHEEEKDLKIERIKKHLGNNSSISEIIRNPLLTTTLCVLANNEIELPNTEIKLYDERLKLLTGYYDRVKQINRIISKPSALELLGQKLAFHLHYRGLRQMDRQQLISEAVRQSLGFFTVEEATTAAEELIDPCNILVPMTETGEFGFGHLRFQEHLAARELNANRGIDIFQLLKSPWWKDCLIMFSRMVTSLSWLIKDEAVDKDPGYDSDIIEEMIEVRPKSEQRELKRIQKTLNRHLDLVNREWLENDFNNDFY